MFTSRARKIGLGLTAVLAAAALSRPLICQSPAAAAIAPAAGTTAREIVVREISDPSTGEQWLLECDPGHPGGPGRLLLVGGPMLPGKKSSLATVANPAPLKTIEQLPVIHSGDRVVVEEHTPLLDCRFEATAMGPARAGGEFRARLDIGGAVVRVIAEGTGRATFAPGESRR